MKTCIGIYLMEGPFLKAIYGYVAYISISWYVLNRHIRGDITILY